MTTTAEDFGVLDSRQTWQRCSNILVVRLDNMGDVLMTTPAFNALKTGSPRRVTLLASKAGASLTQHLPAIDEVVVYEAPWIKGTARTASADRRFLRQLASHRFDAAIIFTVCTQSALPAAFLCRMAGIPLRLAYSRENPYALLTHWQPEIDSIGPDMRHEVMRQLDLVRSVGFDTPDQRLSFRCNAADIAGMQRKLREAGGNPQQRYAVLHPGSSAPSRRYPPERFGRAAQIIAERTGVQIVLTGGFEEREAVAAVQASMRSPGICLAGALTVGELAALIAGASVTICNNSGPAHLAAASQTPVVVLYALTNPQHTPWQVVSRVLNREVPCRNCLKSTCPNAHHQCLMGVEPEAVAEAAVVLLQPIPPRVGTGTHPAEAIDEVTG